MKTEVNNITLHYKKTGKGKPLLLLHGNGEDLHIFDPLADRLKKDYTVYQIDSRNHGNSSKTDDYSYQSMAKDVFCFVKNLNLTDVSVVGFSDGAIIALMLAIENKELFRKMILLGPNLKPTDFKKKEYNYLTQQYEKTKDPLIKLMLEQPDINPEELKKIQNPALVVGGQYDIFYRKVFTDIANTIPGASLKIVKRHDHGSYIIGSDMLYEDIKGFLQ